MRTALALVPDDIPAALRAVYEESYPDGVARGLPLHVTVLIPWVEEVTDEHVERARRAFAQVGPVDFELRELASFPGVLWLRPDPDGAVRALIAAIRAEYPECKPYDGAFDDPTPHATMAVVPEAEQAAVARELEAKLAPIVPVRVRLEEVAVFEQHEPPAWRQTRRIPLR